MKSHEPDVPNTGRRTYFSRLRNSLRFKTLIFAGGTLFVLLIIWGGLTSYELLTTFGDLQHSLLKQQIEKFVQHLQKKGELKLLLLKTYAEWDETYRFLEGSNPGYLEKNYIQNSNTTGEDVVMFFDMERTLVAMKWLNPKTHPVEELSPSTMKAITSSALLQSRQMLGFIAEGSQVLLLAAGPVTRSDHSGPARGWLVFGRWMDQDAFADLVGPSGVRMTGVTPQQQPVAGGAGEDAVHDQLSLANLKPRIFVTPETENNQARVIFPSLKEQAAIGINLDIQMEVLSAAVKARNRIVGFSIAGALCLLILPLWALEWAVLRRIERMNRSVRTLTTSGDDAPLLTVKGEDEIAQLSTSINGLVVSEREARTEAQRANEAKSEFLAMMSHEIRTPMNGILGYTDLLQSTRLTAEQGEYAHTISTSGTALLGIVDDILDLSRIEAGKLEIALNDDFCPVRLLEEVVELFKPQALRKGIELKTDFVREDFVTLHGDEGRVRQVLLNLVNNAVKFTSRGWVLVGMRVLQDFPDRQEIEFTISDTAGGIRPEKLECIFEPFAQADASVALRYGGSGLGLAISRRIVDLLGGNLTAESTYGTGSTFRCILPVQKAAAPYASEPVSREEANAEFAQRHPLRILIAEDDSTSLRLIQRMLNKLGYAPVLSRDGASALEAFAAHHPNCIIMDVQMPGIDGLEATRRIRAEETRLGLKPACIIALSANVLSHEVQDCLDAGMNVHMRKPIHLFSLIDALAAIPVP